MAQNTWLEQSLKINGPVVNRLPPIYYFYASSRRLARVCLSWLRKDHDGRSAWWRRLYYFTWRTRFGQTSCWCCWGLHEVISSSLTAISICLKSLSLYSSKEGAQEAHEAIRTFLTFTVRGWFALAWRKIRIVYTIDPKPISWHVKWTPERQYHLHHYSKAVANTKSKAKKGTYLRLMVILRRYCKTPWLKKAKTTFLPDVAKGGFYPQRTVQLEQHY